MPNAGVPRSLTRPVPKDLFEIKDQIIDLYRHNDRKTVLMKLKDDGVIISDSKLRKFLDAQGIRKNIHRKHYERMIGIHRLRQRTGKSTTFVCYGKLCSTAQLERFVKDHNLDEDSLSGLEMYSGATPKEITYSTPTPSEPDLMDLNTIGEGLIIPAPEDLSVGGDQDSPRINPLFANFAPGYTENPLTDSIHYRSFQLNCENDQMLPGLSAPYDSSTINDASQVYELLWREQRSAIGTLTEPASLWKFGPIQNISRRVDEHWKANRFEDAERLDRLMIFFAQNMFGPEHEFTSRLNGNLACVLSELGQYEDAEKLEDTVVKAFVNSRGEDDHETLEYKRNLSHTFRYQGKWRDAAILADEVVQKSIVLFGDRDQFTLDSKQNLARSYMALERWDKAKPLLEEVSNVRENTLGFSHKLALEANAALVTALARQGYLKEAMELNERIMAEKSRQNHPKTLRWTFESMQNLADLLFDLGQYSGAEEILRKLLLDRGYLSFRHPVVLNIKHDLAAVLFYENNIPEAANIAREVLNLRREVLRPNHPNILTSMADLAWIELGSLGLDAFESTMNKVLILRKETLGLDSTLTLESLTFSAWIHSQRGNLEEAQSILSNVHDKRMALYDSERYPECIDFFLTRAQVFIDNRRNDRAEALLQKAHISQVALHGWDHPRILEIEAKLAEVVSSQGRYYEAEVIASQGLSRLHHTLGTHHPRVLQAMAAQACVKEAMGAWKDAESLRRQIHDAYVITFGSFHLDVASSKCAVAKTCAKQGEFDAAEELYKSALEISIRVVGAKHETVANALSHLAQFRGQQGNWKEACILYAKYLEMKRSLSGDFHVDVISARSSLAWSQAKLGNFSESERLHNENIAMAKQLSPNHPSTLVATKGMADLRTEEERWKEAAGLYRHLLELRNQVLGHSHPDTIDARMSLAWALTELGSFSQGRLLYEMALNTSKTLLGPLHQTTIKATSNLAWSYTQQGDWASASDFYREALKLREDVSGIKDPSAFLLRSNLAWCLREMGFYSKAQTLYEEVLEWKCSTLGKEHCETAVALWNIADLHASQRRFSEEEGYLRRALQIFEIRSSYSHVVSISRELALCFKSQGRFLEAETQAEEALRLSIANLGASHPEVSKTKESLITIQNWMLKYDRALELSRELVEREETLHSESLRLFSLKNLLGQTLVHCRKYEEAEVLLTENLKMLQKSFKEDNWRVLSNMESLATAKEGNLKYGEAEALLLKAQDVYSQKFGDESGHVALCLEKLSDVFVKTENYEKAEGLQERAIKIRNSILSKPDAMMLQQKERLALTKKDLRKFCESQQLLQDVLEARAKLQDNGSPNFARTLSNLACVKRELLKFDEAVVLQRKALRIVKEVFGKESDEYYIELANWTLCLDAKADLQLRRYVQLSVLNRWKLQHGDNSSEVLEVSRLLATTESKLGNFQTAIERQTSIVDHFRASRENKSGLFISTLIELAKIYFRCKDWARCETSYKQAADESEILLGQSHRYHGNALIGLALAKSELGKLTEAEEIQERIIQADREKLEIEDPDFLSSLQNQLWTKVKLKKWSDALALVLECIDIRTKFPGEDEPTIGGLKGWLVTIQQELDRVH